MFAVFGMIIISESLIFLAFIWAYFHLRWGGEDIGTPLNLVPFVYITSTLNAASTMICSILQKNLSSDYPTAEKLIHITILIAGVFLSYQGDEYNLIQCGVNHEWFFTIFLILTGLHSLHVCFGIVLVILSFYFHDTDGSNKLEDFNVGTYWHFVELIWVILTFLLFLM